MADEGLTYLVGRCRLCRCEWQIRSHASPPTDSLACAFCGCERVTLISERPDFSGGRSGARSDLPRDLRYKPRRG